MTFTGVISYLKLFGPEQRVSEGVLHLREYCLSGDTEVRRGVQRVMFARVTFICMGLPACRAYSVLIEVTEGACASR